MAKSWKAPGTLPQTPFGGFTAAPTALCNFHFVKIINAFYGFSPQMSKTFRRLCLNLLVRQTYSFYSSFREEIVLTIQI